ncbi:Trimethylguanosine synthase [Thoreauomyces humboldtii]|nr:Trimethylguanosine synthase [Thoreauomyces humboldtii]
MAEAGIESPANVRRFFIGFKVDLAEAKAAAASTPHVSRPKRKRIRIRTHARKRFKDVVPEETAAAAVLEAASVPLPPSPAASLPTPTVSTVPPPQASKAAAFLASLREQEIHGGVPAPKTPDAADGHSDLTLAQLIDGEEGEEGKGEVLGDEHYIWEYHHMPKELKKYWNQRYSLFSKFDEGIMLDEESWYSVTPEKIAEHHATRMSCNFIIDGFCGAGGNAIQFAKTCKRVVAIDICPLKLRCARNNARLYGVEDRIEFVLGDVMQVIGKYKADAVFLSPPWGGPKYLGDPIYDIKKALPLDCDKLMTSVRAVTKNIGLYMPRNSNPQQLIDLAGPGNLCELEHEYLSERFKAIVAYYGKLVVEKDKA